jgi:Undecaprenyl-phosphate galactose phosphotransferase WbaP
MLTDLAAMLLCYAVTCAFFRNSTLAEFWSLLRNYLLYIPLFLVGTALAGLYPGFSLAPAQELRRYTVTSFAVNGIGMVVNTGFYAWIKSGDEVFILAWLLSIPMLTGCRVLARAVAARSPLWGVPAVVFGAAKEAHLLVDRLLRCRWIGYRPELILDGDREKAIAYKGIPVMADIPRGFDFAKRHGYSTALVALPTTDNGIHRDIIQRYVKAFPTFILFSDFAGLAGVWTSVRDFEGLLGLSTKQKLLIPLNIATKRVIDLLGVLIGAAFFLPFIAFIMLLVKLDSPGPIFYGHRRLGKDRLEFRAWKFRSMIADADNKLAECFETDPDCRKEWDAKQKMTHDPRVTRFGRLLRKTSLDELPQLWNVLKGEMSIVGPRPIVQHEVQFYGTAWEQVSSVLPGITGLWQVSGRSETGFRERVVQDLYYIQNWSIWLDLFIMLKTVWIVLTGKGAC